MQRTEETLSKRGVAQRVNRSFWLEKQNKTTSCPKSDSAKIQIAIIAMKHIQYLSNHVRFEQTVKADEIS